jgi:hypothetical protein
MSDGNKFVTADPQFGNGIILRPFEGFDAVYNGISALTPIMWSPGGEALDSQAGKPGYSHGLLKGMSVPFGARIVLWLPVFGTSSQPVNPYSWQIFWRIRNLYDYRQQRIPYHIAKQSPGAPDTTPITGGPRVLIPACVQSVVYAAAEAFSGVNPVAQTQNVHAEVVVNPGSGLLAGVPTTVTPLTPTGTHGMIKQGVFSETIATAGNPSWTAIEVQAIGDEMLIGHTRIYDLVAHPNWEMTAFGNYDGTLPFGRLNISPDWGVYAFIGSAP